MRLKLYRGGGRKTECICWFYDLDQPVNEFAETKEKYGHLMHANGLKAWEKSYNSMGKKIWGHSYGFKKVAEVTINKGGPILYEFSGVFCEDRIREIMTKARRAAKRTKWMENF
jgi:hypothetical protein